MPPIFSKGFSEQDGLGWLRGAILLRFCKELSDCAGFRLMDVHATMLWLPVAVVVQAARCAAHLPLSSSHTPLARRVQVAGCQVDRPRPLQKLGRAGAAGVRSCQQKAAMENQLEVLAGMKLDSRTPRQEIHLAHEADLERHLLSRVVESLFVYEASAYYLHIYIYIYIHTYMLYLSMYRVCAYTCPISTKHILRYI